MNLLIVDRLSCEVSWYQSLVFIRMSKHITWFLLLANAINIVKGRLVRFPNPTINPTQLSSQSGNQTRCTNTLLQPEVTVADAEHLLVNWTKSFEGCDSSKVLNANVHIWLSCRRSDLYGQRSKNQSKSMLETTSHFSEGTVGRR